VLSLEPDQTCVRNEYATTSSVRAVASGWSHHRPPPQPIIEMFKVLPAALLLLVRWVNLGDHTEGFRGSPAFTRWREIVGPFFAEPPRVEHVNVVATA
jgi:hypothetical protein